MIGFIDLVPFWIPSIIQLLELAVALQLNAVKFIKKECIPPIALTSTCSQCARTIVHIFYSSNVWRAFNR